MSSYSTPSNSPAPTPRRRRLKTCARRCERVCCAIATFFPLAFVYSLTTWAAWVEYTTGLGDTGAKDIGRPMKASSMFGVLLYLLLNVSYTTAVFTDPGSPLNTSGKTKSQRGGGKYSILPTSEPNGHALPSDFESITVSSSGSARFCKKCQTPKPDRTHHCSTCKRCVLKMDHHCPWLATCVGLRNYKAFILFLIYTCFFCYICFASSGYWLWTQMFADDQYLEAYAPVNIIMLAVISCIIGVVLTGFTGWHFYLILCGQTTIECLEKTRYLSGVRSRVERNRREHAHQEATHYRAPSNDITGRLRRAGEDILEFHANAIPGASRYEEGEEHTSPAPSLHKHPSHTTPDIETATLPLPTTYTDYPPHPNDTPATQSLRRAYHPSPSHPKLTQHHSAITYEASRETARYNAYLSERDRDDESAKLPNAFDLGWRRNLTHLFGMNPWFWALPVTNTTGDGWRWEVSVEWMKRKSEVERAKAQSQGRAETEIDVEGDVYDDGGRNGRTVRAQGYDGTYDAGEDARYGRSAVSMQNLHSSGGGGVGRGRGAVRQWGGRYRKDVDRSGETGEEEMFEVSSDDHDGDQEERNEGDEYRDRMWRRSQGHVIDVD